MAADPKRTRGWLRSTTPPEQSFPARAISASARRIDPTDKKAAKPKRAKWQEQAWDVYDSVGEVKFSANYVANILSRLRLFVATMPEPDQPPVEVTDETVQLPGDLAVKAEAALGRLNNAEGGTTELLRALGLNMEVPGDAWLFGLDAREAVTDATGAITEAARPETWAIKSTDELRANGDNYTLHGGPDDGQGKRVPEDAFMSYIWQRHPRYSAMPDSFLRGVMNECIELLLLTRVVRASARSRMNAGLLLVPSELSFGGADPTTAADGDDADDPLTAELVDHAMDPIEDEGDPAGMVPMVVRGKAEYLKPDVFRHIDLSRSVSAEEREQRKELVTRIAQGLNVPPEIIMGLSHAYAQNARQIDRQTFSAHIEPRAVGICDAFTHGFLWPNLAAMGVAEVDYRRVFVWYDESEAVTQPNRAQDAKDLHDRFAISDEALRKAANFGDGDAPGEDELARRVGVKRGIMDGQITEVLLSYLLPELTTQIEKARDAATARSAQEAIDVASADTTPPEGDVATPNADGPTEPVAAASGRRVRNPGEVLSQLDRSLADRLHVAIEAAMDRVLEQAGNRLRSRAQADPAVTAAIRTTPARERASMLGRAVVAGLGVTDADLLGADPWAELAATFDAWVDDTQAAAIIILQESYGQLTEASLASIDARQTADRAEAWAWLSTTLTTLAERLLYEPVTAAGGQRALRSQGRGAWSRGEGNPSLAVQRGVIRQAMAVAGGATGVEAVPLPGDDDGFRLVAQGGTEPVGGVATGELTLLTAEELGAGEPQWQWEWGALGRPGKPFDGHRRLDGLQFADWDDESLAIDSEDGWLGVGFYAPGDHDGCCCFASPIFGQVGNPPKP